MAYVRKKPVFDPTKPFAWSYSKIKNFETCPKRHLEVDILKNWVESTENIDYGNAVHDALASAIGNKGNKIPENPDPPRKPIPASFKELEGFPDPYVAMRGRGAMVATEMDIAINAHFAPTGWFDRDAWFRAKVDVLAITAGGAGPVGVMADWKTGKVAEDTPQLQMTALALFAHYPNLKLIDTRFVWLKADDMTKEMVRVEDKPRLWNSIAPRVRALEIAYKNPDTAQGFPAKPGFLCRKWCPVKSCPHHGG